jgi:Glycine rich protein/Ig domain of plant-specific actin-binding protein
MRRRLVVVAIGMAALAAIPAAAGAQTYTYSGSEQTYTVSAGVTGLHVVLVGAAGSPGDAQGGEAGTGAKLSADIPVPSGIGTLYVEVGGVGSKANPPALPYSATGGFNGGGGGPFGGGGASDIRTVSCGSASGCATGASQASLSSRLAIAGGGGAGSGPAGSAGFYEGGNAGDNTDGAGSAGAPVISGAGATTSTGGQAADQTAVTAECTSDGETGGEPGVAGSLGEGGMGAYLFISDPNSGGGGGGLYGGGGGAQCYGPGAAGSRFSGAGGGGSSGAPGGQSVSITPDYTDPAEVIITAPVPTQMAAPTLTGDLMVGHVLTEGHGTWTSSLPISGYSYQWERCDSNSGSCTAINGATGQIYTLQPVDVGHTVRVQETASNFYGQARQSATSDATGIITASSSAGTNPTPGTTRSRTPVLSGLRVSPSSFSLAGRLVNGRCVRPTHGNNSHPRCQRPIKLKVSYSLTAAVNTTFTLTKTMPGRTVNGRCVKPTAKNTEHAKCTRSLAVDWKTTRAGKLGANSFILDGQLGGRNLSPGTYKLTAASTGGKRRAVTFKVLR